MRLSSIVHPQLGRIALAVFSIQLGALCAALPVPAAALATLTVTTTADELNSDGDCSLREAIEAANGDRAVDACGAGSGADVIIVPAGTYTLARSGSAENANKTGDYDLGANVDIRGAGAGSTQIVGAGLDRLFHVQPGITAKLSALTLRGGAAPTGEDGGAVLNEGSLTIDAAVITTSQSGSGRSCVDVPSPCDPSAGGGGGVYNSGSLTVNATTVRDNSTGQGGSYPNPILPGVPYESPDGAGGGLYNAGILTLNQAKVFANQGRDGGGVYNEGQATVVATSIYANHTTSLPGGISPPGSYGSSGGRGGGIANVEGVLELRKSAVYDNWTPDGGSAPTGGTHASGGSGGDGGGVYNNGVLISINSTVARNRTGAGGSGTSGGSGGDGGGFYNMGTLVLNNMTIAANTSGVGGDGFFLPSGADGTGAGVATFGTTQIMNSLLAANRGTTAGGTVELDCGGNPLTSLGFNLITAGKCSGADAATDRLGVAAQLAPLGNYGGPTPTYALLVVSPAINSGSCIDSASKPVVEDQRGVPRPQFGRCDIGAFEARASEPVRYAFLPFCRR